MSTAIRIFTSGALSRGLMCIMLMFGVVGGLHAEEPWQQDFNNRTGKVEGGQADNMIGATGNTFNNLAQMLLGPVLYTILIFAGIIGISLFAFGKKEASYYVLGAVLLAAVFTGLLSLLATPAA